MKRYSVTTLAILVLIFSIFLFSSAFSAEIVVNRIANVVTGERHTVTIEAVDIASDISSFDILLAHDQSLGMVLNIRAGDLHKDYGWEYFTYRQFSKDSVEANWPGYNTSLLNIIGVASPVGHTTIPVDTSNVVIAQFDVILPIVSGINDYEVWTPFSFFWRDCNDNILISANHDTVFTASGLFEHIAPSERDPVSKPFPGFGLPDHPCSAPNGEEVVEKVEFVNSGILFFTIDPIEQCFNGDINLDGYHYQVDDLVLFINFFLEGIILFEIDPAAQIAQTDCNCDNLVLSIADVVCFFRTVMRDPGGAVGNIPVAGSRPELAFTEVGNSSTLNLISESEISLVYLRVISDREETFELHSSLSEAQQGQIGDTTTLMLINFDGSNVLTEGNHELLTISKNEQVEIEAWVAGENGAVTSYKFENSNLPNSPELLQNYPNPFNPSTTIEFSLPTYTDWSIEIYNVTGQLVNRFEGAAVGHQEVVWDGTNLDGVTVSSGVYFYKLVTKDETRNRKMLLLK